MGTAPPVPDAANRGRPSTGGGSHATRDLLAELIEDLRVGAPDDARATAHTTIAKSFEARGENIQAARWYLRAAHHAEAHGEAAQAGRLRTLAYMLAPPADIDGEDGEE